MAPDPAVFVGVFDAEPAVPLPLPVILEVVEELARNSLEDDEDMERKVVDDDDEDDDVRDVTDVLDEFVDRDIVEEVELLRTRVVELEKSEPDDSADPIRH